MIRTLWSSGRRFRVPFTSRRHSNVPPVVNGPLSNGGLIDEYHARVA
jgi:hypothetical protein